MCPFYLSRHCFLTLSMFWGVVVGTCLVVARKKKGEEKLLQNLPATATDGHPPTPKCFPVFSDSQ